MHGSEPILRPENLGLLLGDAQSGGESPHLRAAGCQGRATRMPIGVAHWPRSSVRRRWKGVRPRRCCASKPSRGNPAERVASVRCRGRRGPGQQVTGDV